MRRTTGLLALAACLVAAGCGSDDEGEPIPANIADQLQTRLNEIERRFDFGNGACSDIENDSRPAVDQLVASVPENVSADVRQALREGFDRLFALSEDQCNQGEQTETETEPETEAAPPPPPETEETTTVTVPPDTTETAPPPETEPAPPETEEQIPPGQGGDAPGGGEGGDGNSGQGGSGSGQGGSGSGPNGAENDSGGALVPEGEG